ncbi:MAG: lipoyl synthase [Bacteroidota bacterium]|nr:lipoyl synthase [Bacteroidota bacterium]
MLKKSKQRRRKPDWLKIKLPQKSAYRSVSQSIKEKGLHTICTSGKCPNLGECWDRGTATLMILGDICTRSCKFCAVKTGKPLPVSTEEPQKVALAVQELNLKHCVLTSVDRDDLKDGGASTWAETIKQIKKLNPGTTIESLIPDFDGNTDLIQQVIDAGPEVISHNLETVRRLSPQMRSKAEYDRSLSVIKFLSEAGVRSKSGIMVGLGETHEEVLQTMDDLRRVGCKVMTIGQYLQPTKNHAEVVEYINPDRFEAWRKQGIQKGFTFIESGPLVRSSYRAEKHV